MTIPCLSQTFTQYSYSGYLPSSEYVIENLDFTEVSSGFLIDVALRFEPIYLYDGTNLDNYNLLDINRFGRIYASMNGAVVNEEAYLLHPDETYMSALENLNEGDPIPIAFLDLHYHKFKTDVVTNNLISETDDQLYDVPNRPESPYLEEVVFIASSTILYKRLGERVVFY